MNKKLNFQIIFSCFLASCLEIYDFVIFGFFSATLYKNYLIFLEKGLAEIIAYAFFAVGFIFRPLGSLIFGYIGDVKGRKKSLVISVSMMGSASLIMFLLPTYSQIGILSCWIIVLVRIIQGISVGGEFTGALIYAIEHNQGNNTGLIAGTISAGGTAGVLLAKLVSYNLSDPNLPEYAWRFAFLIGFGLSIIGYFIRKKLIDSPVILLENKNKIPLFEGIKNFKTECFACFSLAAANGTSFYFATVYLYDLIKAIRLDADIDYSYISIITCITIGIFVPFTGYLAGKLNRYKYLLFITAILCLISPFIINLIVNAKAYTGMIFYTIIFAINIAMLLGACNVFTVEIFPPAYRMSCVSLFFNLGMGFIGGTVPIVASMLRSIFEDNLFILGGYISLISMMSFIGVYLVYKKSERLYN